MSSRHLSFMLIVSTFFAGVCSRYTNEDKDDLMNTCGQRGTLDTVSERIINGTEATPGRWPWMVGLYTAEDRFYCGGVLISRQFVLTAAHCYRDKNSTGFLSVRLGTTKRTNFTVHCQRNTVNKVYLEKSDTTAVHEDLEDQVICIDVDHVCVPPQGQLYAFHEGPCTIEIKQTCQFYKVHSANLPS
uniref:Putative trypsin-like serine protease n=1 Tax=Ixodes ricinus TaxID=34613 RepID=V5HCS8_IXORI